MFAIIDVTNVIEVSHDGLCVDIRSDSIPYVVVPHNLTDMIDQPDCFCPIIINPQDIVYNVSKCSCISDTMFSNSLYARKVWERLPTYEFCFRNLSIEMNESVVHFFESLRYCMNKFGRSVDVNFRRYDKSFKLLVGEYT